MNTLKKVKLIPLVAMVFAMMAMSFQLVSKPHLQQGWYEVGPLLNGDRAIGQFIDIALPAGDCQETNFAEICAVHWTKSSAPPATLQEVIDETEGPVEMAKREE